MPPDTKVLMIGSMAAGGRGCGRPSVCCRHCRSVANRVLQSACRVLKDTGCRVLQTGDNVMGIK